MRTLVVAAVATALPAGCAQSVPGRAGESPRPDPTKVAGLAITTGDTGFGAVAVQDSLIAGAARGVAIPSGSARVEAFRDGFPQSRPTRYR